MLLFLVTAMDTCATQDEQDIYDELEDANQDDIENQPGSSEGNDPDIPLRPYMCPSGVHSWHQNMCMICTVCRECTGYSISCLSSMRPDRTAGQ